VIHTVAPVIRVGRQWELETGLNGW